MKRYYFLLTEHEALLAQMVQMWEAQSPTAYVVLTGVYNETRANNVGQNVESLCYTMAKENIYKLFFSRVNENEWIKFDLLGFILEGELPQNYHDLALSLEGTYCTPSNVEIIQYINELKNA